MSVKLGITQFRAEHRLRAFENRVLRGINGPKKGCWQEGGEDCTMRSSMTLMLHHILLG
jgi:hypothetical protein